MSLATTDQEYYENPSHWGEEQFVTLENIIDNILLTADDDSYFKHAKRFRASIFGKQCIKRLNVHLQPENKAISIQLAPSRTFPYPRYMNNWIRVSVLNSCDKLTTLNVNNSPTIHDYLQDHDYELLYDDTGSVLRANDFNAETGDCCKYIFDCQCDDSVNESCNKCKDCIDNSFKHSWVKDNRSGKYFEFSEDLVDEIVVIEFQSSGLESLNDCDIKIPNILELTVENWIRAQLLKGKRNVPNNEWKEYYTVYKLEKRRAKPFLSKKIIIEQILRSISLRY
jgi:hypothetical protein